ncbi:hypothetical protein [Cellulomonas sp. HZM]|uniref:hypothetical protein n=1 Tax=Cellulomonas sp. HZM TaxID=1454010 RepID=UPI000ABB2447|nr:hypothetical protein [Cellulomonas sp. HZM]
MGLVMLIAPVALLAIAFTAFTGAVRWVVVAVAVIDVAAFAIPAIVLNRELRPESIEKG